MELADDYKIFAGPLVLQNIADLKVVPPRSTLQLLQQHGMRLEPNELRHRSRAITVLFPFTSKSLSHAARVTSRIFHRSRPATRLSQKLLTETYSRLPPPHTREYA